MPLPRQSLHDYFSAAGSFSRKELLAVLLALLATGAVLHGVRGVFPALLSQDWLNALDGLLYTVWGAALGKRSRDLGTTFTYGMLVGMLFPVIGVVFLFQEGKNEKEQAQARAALAAAQWQAVKR